MLTNWALYVAFNVVVISLIHHLVILSIMYFNLMLKLEEI